MLSEHVGVPVYLKLENLQETGSFKLRGAANKILSLTPEEQRRGVIAVSTGNHARAVATVARQWGLNAVICLSQLVPGNKVEALQRLGAKVVIHGQSYDEAAAHAARLQEEQRLTWVDEAATRRQMAYIDRICLAVFGRIAHFELAGPEDAFEFSAPQDITDLMRRLT